LKKPPRSYGFNERLDFSHGHSPEPDNVLPFLKHRIPGFVRVRKAAKTNDRSGTDYYIERNGLFSLAIDLKLRDEDWSIKPPDFADDLALETLSVVETGKIGWTLDASKSADYILWFWKDTGRFFIVPFPPLCCVFQRYWKEWSVQYRTARQHTPSMRRGWHSECVFVPRIVVMDYIGRWMNGYSKTA